MKRSLLLLALMPFCLSLSADSETFAKPETKETTDSYSRNINVLGLFTIEKKKSPNSTTYSYMLKRIELDPQRKFQPITKDGPWVIYKKDRQTKEISGSMTYGDTKLTECLSYTKEEIKEQLKLIKALFKVKKYEEGFAKENKSV